MAAKRGNKYHARTGQVTVGSSRTSNGATSVQTIQDIMQGLTEATSIDVLVL